MVLHMNSWILVFLLVTFIQSLVILAVTDSGDSNALNILTSNWGNKPSSWQSNDPCGGWDGVQCDSSSRVTSIRWASMILEGQLTGDIASLSELQYLDLSYNTGLTGSIPALIGNLKNLINLSLVGCRLTGVIPDSIGSLSQLSFLALNGNGLIGTIPSSIGNLTKLTYLDLSENQLSGTIPVSNATMPGLDNLLNAKHFHFGVNRLSGDIPEKLFNSDMNLLHVLFDNNQLSGSIPLSLGLVQTLEAVRFDNNTLTGSPTSLKNLTNLQELHLSNNKLSGGLPDLSGLQQLAYVDLSNNSFDSSTNPGWFSSLPSLTTLIMENSQLNGPLPSILFSLTSLQQVKLKGNSINGTLELGNSFGNQLELIDLQSNLIDQFTPLGTYSFQLILVSNPFCTQTGASSKWPNFCTIQQPNSVPYSTPTNNCTPGQCSSGQASSPNCTCAYPYTGTLVFRAPTFSNLGISSNYKALEDALMSTFKNNNVAVDSVSLSNATRDQFAYLRISLAIFPDGATQFNIAQLSSMSFLLSNQFLQAPNYFGPYYFIANDYVAVAGGSSGNKSVSVGLIAGIVVAVSVLLLLLIGAGFYALRQKKRAETTTSKTDPFATWDKNKSFGDVPQLKGTRSFTFDELKKCTQDFSDANNIGAGGYGKVYKGVLPGGKVVAIKRAETGSMQGAVEFKNEIELLSRVHHKNLVNLVGFCYEKGEQMLVYEFMPNGTLMDNLAGKSKYNIDWFMRLKFALGSARGLAYLHELADPPIIHRDIKSVNILLDERLNAKVADFGLSKAFGDDQSYVTTQVKGTLGYLDPEYYMTNQLTEKSDVYSFGVVMLELISGRRPIQNGQYIVREVRAKMDTSRDLYALHELLDPAIADTTISLVGFEKFVDLALRCVAETAATRPRMGEVVREIEYIMELGGINPNTDSAPVSSNYGEPSTGGSPNPYSDQSLFDYSGSVLSAKIEPQ